MQCERKWSPHASDVSAELGLPRAAMPGARDIRPDFGYYLKECFDMVPDGEIIYQACPRDGYALMRSTSGNVYAWVHTGRRWHTLEYIAKISHSSCLEILYQHIYCEAETDRVYPGIEHVVEMQHWLRECKEDLLPPWRSGQSKQSKLFWRC